MLVLVLYYKVSVISFITLTAKSTEILGCIVLGLVGMRLNFVTYFVTSHYDFKD